MVVLFAVWDFGVTVTLSPVSPLTVATSVSLETHLMVGCSVMLSGPATAFSVSVWPATRVTALFETPLPVTDRLVPRTVPVLTVT